MTTLNVTPQLQLDANGNLVLGGSAPAGAATTDKLQVNGDALIGKFRFELTTNTITNLGNGDTNLHASARATAGNGYGVDIIGGDANTLGNGGRARILGGAGAGAYRVGGNAVFLGGDSWGTGSEGGSAILTAGGGPVAGNVQLSAGDKRLWFKPDGSLNVTQGSSSSLGGTLHCATVWTTNARFGIYSATGDAASNGYITVTDDAGNTRKLMTRA